MFLNGFLLASLFYFKTESSYENGLFASIKNAINVRIDNNDTPDSVLLKAMSVSHLLMSNRQATFTANGTSPDLGLEASIFRSTAVDLMTTDGACGSYSQVLARILRTYNYPVRIAQMKAQGIYGAHNIVEAYTGNKWVVLDPTFDLSFVRPDNTLASFADVQHDWSYYSKQVPKGYNMDYHYEDVRYTNWTKIPVLFPALKGLLTLFIGSERTNSFSIRTLFMNTYATYFYIVLALYIPLFLMTCKRAVKTKVFPSPDIPFTFRNLIKYLKPQPQSSSFMSEA
jgi:hypothetical protein